MKVVIKIMIILFIISIAVAVAYTVYMSTKKKQFPKVDFSRFKTEENDTGSLEVLVNNAINGVNGWMWLATAFMAIYYFISFWSIAFMLLSIVVVAYEVDNYRDITIFLTCGSLLFTCLDLWVSLKEKSIHFNDQWFATSAITKEYIVKFSAAKTFEELCAIVTEFNNKIYDKNAHVHLL